MEVLARVGVVFHDVGADESSLEKTESIDELPEMDTQGLGVRDRGENRGIEHVEIQAEIEELFVALEESLQGLKHLEGGAGPGPRNCTMEVMQHCYSLGGWFDDSCWSDIGRGNLCLRCEQDNYDQCVRNNVQPMHECKANYRMGQDMCQRNFPI